MALTLSESHFFKSLSMCREETSEHEDSGSSDLETPVKGPTPGRGQKRAAGILKATPVLLYNFFLQTAVMHVVLDNTNWFALGSTHNNYCLIKRPP